MGLTFEVVSELEQKDDFVTSFLENRGVENPEIFLNPDDHLETFYTDPLGFYNITDAVKLLDKSIENNDLIGVLVDDDADGYSSASAFQRSRISTEYFLGSRSIILWQFLHNQIPLSIDFLSS